MFFRQFSAYVILCASFSLVSAHAEESEKYFSLALLQELALRSSPAFEAIQSQIEAARAGISTAKAYPNPEIEVSSIHSRPRTNDISPTNARSSSLTQPLDLPNRRWARIDAAEAGFTATVANSTSNKADLLAQIRIRYYDHLRREAELLAAREDNSLIEAVRDRIAKRVEAGESPRFELIKVETELLNAQKGTQSAVVRVQQAKAIIRQLVGRSLPANFILQGHLTDVQEPPALSIIRPEIMANNPDLRRARAEAKQAEAQLDYAQALRWPDLAVKVGRDDEPEFRTNQIGIVMTFPLWDWKSGPVAEARANHLRTQHLLSQQELTLEQDIDLAYQQLEISRNQIEALENGIIRQAEAALRVAEQAYRHGERGFLDVLDAQRVFRAARNELIGARFDFAAACSDIERLRAKISEN